MTQTLQLDTMEFQPMECERKGCVPPGTAYSHLFLFQLLDAIEHGDLKSCILKMMKPQDEKGPSL